jgi:hypothetical protein
MAEEGQLFEAPDGNTLRLVRISDELLEMEATYGGEGAMPPPHLHPAQDERFEALYRGEPMKDPAAFLERFSAEFRIATG